MPTVNGHYRMEAPGARFFAATVMHLRARDHIVIGHFGRRGFLRGELLDSTVNARWRYGDRVGWITMHFVPDYKTAHCAFGSDDGADSDSMPLRKLVRPSKPRVRRSGA